MTARDARQIRLAAVANRIYGAFHLAAGLVFAFMVVAAATDPDYAPDTVALGGVSVPVLAAGVTLSALGLLVVGAATWAVGNRLKKRRQRGFCIVVSAVNALSMPVGTLVGGMTIVLLMRSSVADAFEANPTGVDQEVEMSNYVSGG